MTEENNISINDYLTVSQFAAEFPGFTEGSLRALIHKRHENGFEVCMRRIGRKILISKSAFAKWIEDANKGR